MLPPPHSHIDKVFFSLIIPVYNVERYIRRCLQSCVNQTFKNIEILIIDDCGNDTSMEIAEEFAKRDSRIRIIHHPHNRGLFYARITGEEEAKGEYIIHVDSDDFIRLETCQNVYEAIQSHHQKTQKWVDICTFGFQTYPNKPIKLSFETFKRQISEQATKALVKQWQKRYASQPLVYFFLAPLLLWNIWARAYKTELIHQANRSIKEQIPDVQGLTMGEDVLKFFFIVSLSSNNINLSKQYYFYCDNPSSAMREKENIQKIKKYIRDLQTLIHIFQKLHTLKSNQRGYYRVIKIIEEALDMHRTLLLQRYFILLQIKYKTRPWKKLPFWTFLSIRSKLLYHQWSWRSFVRISLYLISLGKI